MKKIIYITILLSGIQAAIHAQSDYKSAVGLRIGDGYYDLVSASLKIFLGKSPGALEVNIGFRNYGIPGYDWFNVSGSVSYQYHFNIGSIEGLKWFIGGGAIAFNTFSSYEDYKGFGIGVFPTGGVDYKFSKIPLDVSADIRPTIEVVKPYDYYSSFYLGNVGISARYTFK